MSDSNKKPEIDSRLKNLTNALFLTTEDDVALRTGITGDIIITGTVNIPGEVTVSSTPEDPVHSHISEVGTSGILDVPYMPIGGTVSVDNFPATQTDTTIADSNYGMNVARGLVAGQYPVIRSGYNPNCSNGTSTSVWVEGGIYPFTTWTIAQRLYVISTSSSDSGQQIYIEGLDSNYNPITETVTTTGTSAVATTQNFLRIHTATIISANSPNVGEITFRLTSGVGTVVAHIGAGLGITKLSQYTVPAGYTAYVQYGDATTFRSGSGNIGALLKMMVRPFGRTFVAAFLAEVVNGYYRNDFNVPMVLPAKSDIDVQVTADGNGTAATVNWQMILIPNS